MKAHNLLPARKYTERPEHLHDGKVIVMRPNLRWCSDGFEFTCWNGDIVRGAFIIDVYDREIIAWRAICRKVLCCRAAQPLEHGPTTAG